MVHVGLGVADVGLCLHQVFSKLLVKEVQSVDFFHQENCLKSLLPVFQNQSFIGFFIDSCGWCGEWGWWWGCLVVVDGGVELSNFGFVVVDGGVVLGDLKFIVVDGGVELGDGGVELVDLCFVGGDFLGEVQVYVGNSGDFSFQSLLQSCLILVFQFQSFLQLDYPLVIHCWSWRLLLLLRLQFHDVVFSLLEVAEDLCVFLVQALDF